jgi:hypothetical protein
MSYRKNSYRRYREYRNNRWRYEKENGIITFLILLSFFLGIKDFIVGVVVLTVGIIVAYWIYELFWKRYRKRIDGQTIEERANDYDLKIVDVDEEKVLQNQKKKELTAKFINILKQRAENKSINIKENNDNCTFENSVYLMGEIMKRENKGTTITGYINQNNQRNNGKTEYKGTDVNQWLYDMECMDCGHRYYANGSDIWLRKCPKCQGGQP